MVYKITRKQAKACIAGHLNGVKRGLHRDNKNRKNDNLLVATTMSRGRKDTSPSSYPKTIWKLKITILAGPKFEVLHSYIYIYIYREREREREREQSQLRESIGERQSKGSIILVMFL